MHNISAYLWNFISKFGSQVLYLLTTMVLARYLLPEDFGVIGILSIIFMVANTLTESGLGGALVIEKEITKEDCATIFLFNIAVSGTIYLLLLLGSDFVERFYDVDGLAKIARILGLVFVINSFGIVPRTLLYRQLNFKGLCITTLAGVIAASVVSIILAIYNWGPYALVAYQITSASIITLGTIILSKYTFPLGFRTDRFKKFFNFGYYTTITGIIDTVYENIIASIFGKYLSVSDAGYLIQAKKLEEASSQSLIMTINNTAFPILSKYRSDLQFFKKEADTIIFTIPLIISPAFIVLCLFSKEIILLLFGDNWLPASDYLSILVIASLFMIMDAINRNFIKSLGFVKYLFHATILKRVIGCLIIFISGLISVQYILYGYVVSSIVGFTVNCIIYAKVIHANVLHVFVRSTRCLTHITILWIVSLLIDLCIGILSLKIVSIVVILIVYYVIVLPYYKIDIIGYIKQLLFKKNK